MAIQITKPLAPDHPESLKVKQACLIFVLFAVNVTAIKTNVERDVSFCEISNLCQRNDDNSLKIISFELPPVITTDMLSSLHEVQQSLTFQELWTQHGKRAQTARMNDEAQPKDLSISKLLKYVWKPAYKAWKQIGDSTLDGSINLGEVDKFFSGYKDKQKDLGEELFYILNLDRSHSIASDQLKAIAKKRAEQMQLYQQIHHLANAAETVWEFKQAMGFSGDFKIVEELRNQVRRVNRRQSKGRCLYCCQF